MAIKCPDCGHWNDDELIFCEECGEPIDPKTRLMMELEGKKAPTNYSGVKKTATQDGSSSYRRNNDDDDDDDDDDYVSSYNDEDEKKKSPIGWLLLLVVAAAAVYFLFIR